MTSRAVPALTMPELSLPFPACTPHPDADPIDAATVQWLLDHGLIAGAAQERYVREIGVGRWFPSLLPAGDARTVLLGAQLTAWFTMLDDQVAEKQGRQGDLAELMRVIVHSEDIARLPDGRDEQAPIQRALQDLALRLREALAPEQAARLHGYALQFYLGIAAEAAYTSRGELPPLVDYQRIRRLNTCMPPFFVMSEAARGQRLPLGLLREPDVQRLTALAVDLTAITNDIIGLPRDLGREDPWLLTGVLARERRFDAQASLDWMTTKFYADVGSFVELAGRLRGRDEHMPRYITILQDVVAGHLAWSKSSPRYKIGGWH